MNCGKIFLYLSSVMLMFFMWPIALDAVGISVEENAFWAFVLLGGPFILAFVAMAYYTLIFKGIKWIFSKISDFVNRLRGV